MIHSTNRIKKHNQQQQKKIEHFSHYHKTNGVYSVHLNKKKHINLFKREKKILLHIQ